MSKEAILKARTEMKKVVEDLVAEAREIIDDYWVEWRVKNKELGALENAVPGKSKYLRGNIAPRITVRTGKHYLEWVFYGPGRYGSKNKSWGDRIQPRKGPYYHLSQFKKAQDWEYELIETAEMKLRYIRYALESIHTSQIYLKRLIVKINQQTDENSEDQND
ncbi:conjugative transfer protein MobI(A/C) [uncultured Pseudoalteromonas sp.]|uniref:conjugative transfer protein MobI(A/C) n=1 Tax=uncultured Pseudoalteromonas sp. TaxID=114053 RepID=UPI0025982020|nr:conjugative transfer protein MobI(A/C) [uncultured Pseudoalteromonas sp.]